MSLTIGQIISLRVMISSNGRTEERKKGKERKKYERWKERMDCFRKAKERWTFPLKARS